MLSFSKHGHQSHGVIPALRSLPGLVDRRSIVGEPGIEYLMRGGNSGSAPTEGSTLASFHLRAPAAVSASPQRAARISNTLLAAMETPVPVQQ